MSTLSFSFWFTKFTLHFFWSFFMNGWALFRFWGSFCLVGRCCFSYGPILSPLPTPSSS